LLIVSGETTGDFSADVTSSTGIDGTVPELGALVDQFLEAVSDVQAALPELTPADLAYSLDEVVSDYLEQHSLPVDDYAVLEQHVLHALVDDLQGDIKDDSAAVGGFDDAAVLDPFAVLEAYSSSLILEHGTSTDVDGSASFLI
jgi:hypothetical protein